MEHFDSRPEQGPHKETIESVRDHFSLLWNLSPIKESEDTLVYIFTQDPHEMSDPWIKQLIEDPTFYFSTEEVEREGEGYSVFYVTINKAS